ncbi:MAG: hypothetical protein V7641_4712 [Blastocatellia bacterium]
MKFTRFLMIRFFLALTATALIMALLTYQTTASLARTTQEISPFSTFDQTAFASTQNESASMLYATERGLACREATAAEASMFTRRSRIGLHTISPIHTDAVASQSRGLRIVLRATPQLERFPEAQSAFLRSAAIWEDWIQTPITIVIDVDYGPTLFGAAWPGQSIGGSSAQELTRDAYSTVREQLIAHASSAQELAICQSLPVGTIPTDIGAASLMKVPSANARALGLLDAIADPDGQERSLGKPPSVGFNSNQKFDFDPSDGIDPDKVDFEAVVLHEIGHVLGFISSVGVREVDSTSRITPTVWDLFRLRPETPQDGFSTAQRILSSGGEQRFTAAGLELPLSTGRNNGTGGDGFQASHWKNDRLISNRYIGVMEVEIMNGKRQILTSHDLIALDLMGYELRKGIPLVPEPGDLAGSLQGDMLKVTGLASNAGQDQCQAEVKVLDQSGQLLTEYPPVVLDPGDVTIANYEFEFFGLNQLRSATQANLTLIDRLGNRSTTVTTSLLSGDSGGPKLVSVSFDGNTMRIKAKRLNSQLSLEINGVLIIPSEVKVISSKKVQVNGNASELNLSSGANRIRIINNGLRSNILMLNL